MKKRTNYVKHFAGLFALALMFTMMVGIKANAAGTTYYVNKTTIFKLYSDSACTSAVENDTVLQGGDTIVCANGSYAFDIMRESEQQYVGYDFLTTLDPGESYTIPDGSYEWDDSEGCFVLNRIAQPTEPETPPAEPVTPSTDSAYYVSVDHRGCKLYGDSNCNSEVSADTRLKYGDKIKCTVETGIHVYLGETLDKQLTLFDATYTVPDGEYTFSFEQISEYKYKLTLTRIILVIPPTDQVTPSVTPSVSSTLIPVVEKEEDVAPALALPVLKSTNYAGNELCSWQEVIDAIVTIEPKKLTDSNPEDTQSVLKVDISSTAGFVGHEVLQTLAKKDDASLHVFTGNGVAITFAGADVKDDAKAVRVTNKVSDKEENGKRVHIVDFLEKGKLGASVAFHVNLPQGADSSVDVYTENKDGIQNHIRTMKADSAGNVAFMINTKEKFVFKY